MVTVYPRVCGGTEKVAPFRRQFSGLSPRVRGNPTYLLQSHPLERSIPACAGEPATRQSGRRRGKVYPRVCGGTGKNSPWCDTLYGLSPRVRGTNENDVDKTKEKGLSPRVRGNPRRIQNDSK